MTNPAECYSIRQGESVQGQYHGVSYRGTVESVQLHTMNHRLAIFNVALSEPILVFGLPRFNINVYAPSDPYMTITATR